MNTRFLETVCMSGTYGENCSKRCSSHCDGQNKSCDHINGWCNHGCMNGYQGNRCDTGKDNGTESVSTKTVLDF